jgi:hypothetical protein
VFSDFRDNGELSKVDVNDIAWITSVLLTTKLPYASLFDILYINFRVTEARGFRWLAAKMSAMPEKRKRSRFAAQLQSNEAITRLLASNGKSTASLLLVLISRAAIELEMGLRSIITVIINELEASRPTAKTTTTGVGEVKDAMNNSKSDNTNNTTTTNEKSADGYDATGNSTTTDPHASNSKSGVQQQTETGGVENVARDVVTTEEKMKMVLLVIPLLQHAFDYVLEQIG